MWWNEFLLEPSYAVGRNVNWCSHYGGSLKPVWRFLKKLKIEWSCNPTPGHISRENSNLKRYMHPSVHCGKTWKQPKCPSADEWIHKMWYIHTTGYCSAIEKRWKSDICDSRVNLENITLSERSQTQKSTCCVIASVWNVQNRQITVGVSTRRKRERLLTGMGFFLGVLKMF